jgi:CHAT domain-containing protein/tetratricopeptide (TPR) repeat protein
MVPLVLLGASSLLTSAKEPMSIRPGETIHGTIPPGEPGTTSVAFLLAPGVAGPLTIEAKSLELDAVVKLQRIRPDGGFTYVSEGVRRGRVSSRILLDADGAARYRIEVRPDIVYDLFCGNAFDLTVTVGQPAKLDAKARDLASLAYWKEAEARAAEKGNPACTVRLLLGRAEDLRMLRRATEARPLAEQALALAEAKFGPDHLLVASCAEVLAWDLRGVTKDEADPAAAIDLEKRALAIREKALGPEHLAVADCLFDLAISERRIGQYASARPYYERALAIREKALGADDDVVQMTQHDLAGLLNELGENVEAKRLFERLLASQERTYGPDSSEAATTWMELSTVAQETGDAAESVRLCKLCLARLERLSSPMSEEEFFQLNNCAGALLDIGDYAEAEPALDRALAFAEKTFGADYSYTAYTLKSLGDLARLKGDYATARPRYERAIAIMEKSYDPDYPPLAEFLMSFADLLHQTGQIEAALPLVERSLAIWEKSLGPDHPLVAQALDRLAMLRNAKGESAAARPLLERALAIEEKSLGAEDPQAADTRRNLAEVLADLGDVQGALDSALRAELARNDHVRLTSRSLPERQALRYAATTESSLPLALTLAANGLEPASRRRVWDAVVRSRALVLDEMAARHGALARSNDAAIPPLLMVRAAASTRLANLVIRGPDDGEPAKYRKLLDDGRREKEQAEQALAAKNAAFREGLAREGLGWKEVAFSLPSGSALVAYALYDRYDLPREPEKAAKRSVPSYLAFVLRGGSPDAAALPLGAAQDVDSLIAAWQREAAHGAFAPGRSAADARAAYRSAGDALRRKVWDPIAAKLKGAERVFVVPDGALHLVSLASLPIGKTQYLIETEPLVHYLSAERDLVLMQAAGANGKGLLALGGAAFDATSSSSASPAAVGTASSTFRGGRSGCGGFQSIRFEPLPGSAREVDEIAGLWSRPDDATAIDELKGVGASEGAFKKSAQGHRILHLATHGFFLGGRCVSALDSSRGVAGLVTAETAAPRPVVGENPLLLSGLALAGANHRDAAGPDEEDGILSAEEIASLDLSGVEWAVLSACDTGVGEIKAGEGVFGLRRAFQLAGARTLIMSLWSVDDEATRSWMRSLYTGRLESHLDTAEAVRQASLEVLRDRRKRNVSTHPFYWAAFVAAGDWR